MGQASGADLEVTHTTPAAKLLSVITYPSIFDGDVVTYTGSVARPAHTLEDLHRVVLKAQEAALTYWGFTCSRLEVQFFTDGNVMGLAYNPGSGKSSGKRLISLNARLLQSYTIDTIWRTVIHELCHHARNERFAINYVDQHDSYFCDMLSKADPLAQDKSGCTFFTEQEDSSLAAGIRQRKAGPIPPVYDPELGTVYLNRLKSGAFRIGWVPTEKAVARWKSIIVPLTSSAIEDIVKNFSPAQWGMVTVTTENYPYRVKPESLADLIQTLIKSYPLQMRSLITYLNTMAAA
jgi:predicted SprT family Zn-dependent metalloprotease